MERVRRAAPEDLDRCTDLLVAARREVFASRGGPLLLASGPDATARRRADDPAATVSHWAADSASVLLVGLFDEVVVGLAAGEAPAATGVIACCYVEPAARRVGVGSALADALVSWFVERGCTGVDAWALPGDRPSKQLLEAAGFSARLLVLHRPLP